MFMKVLRAVPRDLFQATEDEILVPNPMIMPREDNDFFVGVQSRRPARYGRVTVLEGSTPESIVQADLAGMVGASTTEAPDEERREDVLFLLDAISDFEVGALVGCRYEQEDDEVSWEIFEIDEELTEN